MKNVFITGITGLLGTNLASELLQQGYNITAIVRNPENYIGPKNPNLNLVQMGLWDSYDSLLQYTDIVVHIAAQTATNLLNYSEYETTNYKATVRLFDKSIKQGVSKFIFISTANTIGYGTPLRLGTEELTIKKPFTDLYYAQSKLRAEEYLISRKNEIKIKVLNPTFMIGPYDSKPSSGKIILMGINRKLLFYPPGGKNFVPVKDVVNAIISSFTQGPSGEKFLIAGENLSYKSFFKKLNLLNNQHQVLLPIPRPLLHSFGIIGNCLRKFNIKTSLSLVNTKILCTRNFYSNKKSIDQLGITYSSLDTAICESIDFFRSRK